MKTKNIIKYREDYTGQPSKMVAIGDKDPLLDKFYGAESSVEDYTNKLNNFAASITTQIFYEALQNAEDATNKSTSGKGGTLVVVYDENFMLVANNGADFRLQREGRDNLRSMLSLEKSDKAQDDNSIGKMGMGFKLMHMLMIDEISGDSTPKNKLLDNKYFKERKSPILFSWSKLQQIQGLLEFSAEQPFSQTGDWQGSDALLVKLFAIYFPTLVGETHQLKGHTQQLFEWQEVQNLSNFLNSYRYLYHKGEIYKDLDIRAWETGSLFFIPLGVGKKTDLDRNLSGILDGLASSLPLLRCVSKVQINDNIFYTKEEQPIAGFDFYTTNYSVYGELSPTKSGEIKSLKLPFDIKEDGKTIPSFATLCWTDFSNKSIIVSSFYKVFPIPKENFELGFSIHFEKYILNNNRQQINDWGEDYAHTEKIWAALEIKLNTLQVKDKKAYLSFFKTLILHGFSTSKVSSGSAQAAIEPFMEKLKQYISTNAVTNRGEFKPINQLRVFVQDNWSTPISLPELGVADCYWLDEEIKTDSQLRDELRKNYGLKDWGLREVINHAFESDPSLLEQWAQQLNASDYATFLSVATTPMVKKMLKLSIIRGENAGFYSMEDFINQPSLLLLDSRVKSLKGTAIPIAEYGFVCSAVNFELYPNWLDAYKSKVDNSKFWEKITKVYNSHIPDMGSDEVWDTLNWAKSELKISEAELAKASFFTNQAGEQVALNQTLAADSIRYKNPLIPKKYKLVNKYRRSETEFVYQIAIKDFYLDILQDWGLFLSLVRIEDEKSVQGFYKLVQSFYQLADKKVKEEKPNNGAFIYGADGQLHECAAIIVLEQQAQEAIFFPKKPIYREIKSGAETVKQFFGKSLPHPSIEEHIYGVDNCFYRKSEKLKLSDAEIKLSQQEAINLILIYEANGQRIFDSHLFVFREEQLWICSRGNKKQVMVKEPLIRKFLDTHSEYFIQLPEGLQGAAKTAKLEEDAGVLRALVGKYRASVDLLGCVADNNQFQLWTEYLNGFTRFDFYINQDDLGARFLQLLIDFHQSEEHAESEKAIIRSKIYIDDKNLAKDLQFSDSVTINKNEFSLSDLLPSYVGTSAIVAQFLKKYQEATRDLSHLLDTKSKPEDKVFEELKKIPLSKPSQINFSIQYNLSIAESKLMGTPLDLRPYRDLEPAVCLQLLFEHQVTKYSECHQLADFVPQAKILTTQEPFTIPSERLPAWVMGWVNDGNAKQVAAKKDFLYKVGIWKEEDTIPYRQKAISTQSTATEWTDFYENYQYVYNSLELFSQPPAHKDAQKALFEFLYQEPILFNSCVGAKPRPLALFQGSASSAIQLVQRNASLFYIDSRVFPDEHMEKAIGLLVDNNIQLLDTDICPHNVVNFAFGNNIKPIQITAQSNIEKLHQQSIEWEAPHYQEWAKEFGFKIKFLNTHIPYKHYLNDAPKEVLYEKERGDTYIDDKTIFISKIAYQQRDMWELLEEVCKLPNSKLEQPDIQDFFKREVKFNHNKSLINPDRLNDLERLEEIKKQFSSLNIDILNPTDLAGLLQKLQAPSNTTAGNMPTQGSGNGNIQIAEALRPAFEAHQHALEQLLQNESMLKNIDTVVEQLGGVDEENLQKLLEYLKKLTLEDLEALPDIDKEVGAAGEQRLYQLLVAEYGENYVYSQHSKVSGCKVEDHPAYDFKIINSEDPTQVIYIDAKTTKTDPKNSKNIPFFMREPQWEFIGKNCDEGNYYVARLSLQKHYSDLSDVPLIQMRLPKPPRRKQGGKTPQELKWGRLK